MHPSDSYPLATALRSSGTASRYRKTESEMTEPGTREGSGPDVWAAIGADDQLNRARKVLSMHELRLIIRHADPGWKSIETAPKDQTAFLAWCPPCAEFPDGRMMQWNGSILALQNDRTPAHLRFPATHWRPMPRPPVAIGFDALARSALSTEGR